MRVFLKVGLGLVALAYSLFYLAAVTLGIEHGLDFGRSTAAFFTLAVAPIPLVGSVFATIGISAGWGWAWYWSALLSFGPFLLLFAAVTFDGVGYRLLWAWDRIGGSAQR